MIETTRADGLRVSGNPELLDRYAVFGWISGDTYWAAGRPRETMDRAMAGSECVGVYDRGRQVAFVRIVTDGAVFAYLCDVYVDRGYRGRGIGKWLVAAVRDDLRERGLNRILLVTRDAQPVYAAVGFEAVDPERWMICNLKPEKA